MRRVWVARMLPESPEPGRGIAVGAAVAVTEAGSRSGQHTATAMRGMSWMAINTIVSRLAVFLSQLVLGYLLNPADFGLYALALSVTASLGGVRNGGTVQLLTARGLKYRQNLALYSQYALALNTAALVVLGVLAWLASAAKQIDALGWLVVAIGLSFPLGTPASVYRTELSILGRFRELAILSTASTVLWQIEVIGLAALGCGAYSLAIPMVLQSVFDGLMGWHYLRHWPLHGRLITLRELIEILRETRWIMAGLVMLALGLAGPYFVAGLFTDPTTVGLFFFGFQLAFTLFTLLNASIEAVLPPMLARLNGEPQQQAATTLQMLRILVVVSLPLAGAVAIGAHLAVHLLWAGRWDRSAPVVSIMVCSLPAWIGFQIVRALLEARGRWIVRLVTLAVFGVGSCTVVAIAATGTRDLVAMAAALSGFYVLFGLGVLCMLPSLVGVAVHEVFGVLVKPLAACALCALLGLAAARTLPSSADAMLAEVAALLVYSVTAATANWWWFRTEWRAALGTFLGARVGLSPRQPRAEPV
jgi:lipopolysaccharide exporter